MVRKTPENPSLVALLSTVLLLGPALVLLSAPPVAAEVVNRIVLRVNDRVVTLQDYQVRRAQMLSDLAQADLSQSEKEGARKEIGERVFRDLYEENLLLSRADQMDVRVPEEHLDQVLEQVRERMGVPDEESFELALAQTGMTLEDFRERWRTNLRMREVTSRELHSEIAGQLSRQRLRRVYRDNPERFQEPERVRLREVVVLEEGTSGPEERHGVAERMQQRVQGGEDLADVAVELAEAGTTSEVIDLGWVEHGELSSALEAVAFELEAGQLSEPIRARGGLHLVEVLERREASPKPFSEVVDEIRQSEQNRLFAERYEGYMDDLEERSFVRADPPPGASGFRAVESSVVTDVGQGEAPAAAPSEGAEPLGGGPVQGDVPADPGSTAPDEPPAASSPEDPEGGSGGGRGPDGGGAP